VSYGEENVARLQIIAEPLLFSLGGYWALKKLLSLAGGWGWHGVSPVV